MDPYIKSYTLGALGTNTYLLGDPDARQAVIIDPAEGAEEVVNHAVDVGYQVVGVWLTHAHFDHLTGIPDIERVCDPLPPIALHRKDLTLYKLRGGGELFGFRVGKLPDVNNFFEDGQEINLGAIHVKISHVPGHSPGHVVMYVEAASALFCGDVIFQQSIGRTDLPGGSYRTLIANIQEKVLTLPPETTLYCGHGPATTVGHESIYNPFL